jgi:hypothetical protein
MACNIEEFTELFPFLSQKHYTIDRLWDVICETQSGRCFDTSGHLLGSLSRSTALYQH